MAKWEELPIADRAQYMRIAVQNGYRDIRSIREAYNKYAEGGPVRVHKNESSTAKESTILEDRVAKVIANTKEIDHRYDIPYIEDKEMKINGIIIPTNALDSLAKYAGKTNTPLDRAIALGFESGYGRQPYFNYGQEKVSDRAIGNMNYFKNYGSIPAHLFVRDYEYIKGGYNNGKPYYEQDPLEHSMNYLNSGRYNTKLRVKDKDTGKILNHTQLLDKLAKQLNQDSNYLLWKKQSGLKEYSGEAEKERTRKKAHETYKTQHPFKAAIKDLFGIEYADGGDIYDGEAENTQQMYRGILPFKEIVVYPTQEEQRKLAVRRALQANSPNFNFMSAQDLNSKERRSIQKKSNNMRRKPLIPGVTDILDAFSPRPYNCINTATGWITNGKETIARNKNLYNNPSQYGYTSIPYTQVEPGDLIQYISDGKPWHAGIVTGKDRNKFNVRSSSGDINLNPVRYYNTSEFGKEGIFEDTPKFYRYKYPHEGVEFIKAEGGPKNGYKEWLENEARLNSKIWEMPYVKALDQMKNDRSYDYRKFYELQKANPYNPEYQRDLEGNAHYNDIGKSVYHPTASTGSYYSGRKDPKWNPTGAKFGEWLDNNHEYRLSDDMLRAGSNPYETFDYLGANEEKGVRLRDERGLMFRDYREPEETYIGGVFPSIIVKAPRKH